MTRPATPRFLGHDFDAFLFAPVDSDSTDDEKAGALSVLSALARLDVDPWSEAATLAGMQPAAARNRLASLIGALPDSMRRQPPVGIADRLLALLPRSNPAAAAALTRLPGAGAAITTRSVATMILLNLFIMFAMICAQWTIASLQPAAMTGTSHAAVARLVAPFPDAITGPRDGRPARAFPGAKDPVPGAP